MCKFQRSLPAELHNYAHKLAGLLFNSEDFENVFDLGAALAEPYKPRGDKITVEKIG